MLVCITYKPKIPEIIPRVPNTQTRPDKSSELVNESFVMVYFTWFHCFAPYPQWVVFLLKFSPMATAGLSFQNRELFCAWFVCMTHFVLSTCKLYPQ